MSDNLTNVDEAVLTKKTNGNYNRIAKRGVDLFISIPLLVILSPFFL
jgi:lipopolysaccharide/colanic/teichoic acid biosynthesis glycosyltransferase